MDMETNTFKKVGAMNLYLVTRNEETTKWGVYDSAVVVAASEYEAVRVQPPQFNGPETWAAPDSLSATITGYAIPGFHGPTWILGSFKDI